MVLTWNLELGTWNLEPGTWILELGTWILEPGTWNLELGSWILELQHPVSSVVKMYMDSLKLLLNTKLSPKIEYERIQTFTPDSCWCIIRAHIFI